MKFRRNTTCSLYGCIIVFLFIIAASAGCGGSSEERISFSPSDLEGNWKIMHYGRIHSGPFSAYGSIDVNASGGVAGGSITNFGVDIQRFTGGAFVITPEGIVTGILDAFLSDSNTYEKLLIYNGQMATDKGFIIYAANFDLGRKGIGVLVKEGGNYVNADLQGTWVFPLDGLFTLLLTNTGDLASCSYISAAGDALQCTGNIKIMPDGSITGRLGFPGGKPFTIDFNGRISQRKDIMIIAGGISTRFEGMSTMAVRSEKAYSPADAKGKWKVFMSINNDVLYGTVDINGSGTVTGGGWKNSQKTSGTFTGGKVLYSKDRNDISGFISTSAGHTYTILGGALSPSGDVLPLSAKDEAGHDGMLVLVKDISKL